jgi:hypothetical protein
MLARSSNALERKRRSTKFTQNERARYNNQRPLLISQRSEIYGHNYLFLKNGEAVYQNQNFIWIGSSTLPKSSRGFLTQNV